MCGIAGNINFHTDDHLFVVGSKDNQLKVGGHCINTQEIEDVIMVTGLTIEVAVVGTLYPLLGNKLVAILVPVNPALKAADVLSVCSRKLPSFKVPQDVCFVPNLPKSASGKENKPRCETLIKVL